MNVYNVGFYFISNFINVAVANSLQYRNKRGPESRADMFVNANYIQFFPQNSRTASQHGGLSHPAEATIYQGIFVLLLLPSY